MKGENITKFILATVTSAVGGAVIGLLMAPEKGTSTRKKIAEESDKFLEEIKKNVADLRNELGTRASSAQTEIDELGKDAKRKKDDVTKRAKKMASYDEWTKEELYDEAKDKEIENYSTMNKAELIEALRNQ